MGLLNSHTSKITSIFIGVIIFTGTCVVPCGSRKTFTPSPVHHHSVDCICWSFWRNEFNKNHFEMSFLQKPVLQGCPVYVTNFISGYFVFFGVALASKGLTIQNLIKGRNDKSH